MRKKYLNVLVVDDSPVVLEHLRFVLQTAGHKVTTREDALGTVGDVMKMRPDVLILDVSMPVLGGDRLASVVLQFRRDIVLILHSSLDETALRELANATGAHGVIRKRSDSRSFLGEFNRIVFGEAPQSSAGDCLDDSRSRPDGFGSGTRPVGALGHGRPAHPVGHQEPRKRAKRSE